MNRICLEIRHDRTCVNFAGDILTQVRGLAPIGDPYSFLTGIPEIVLYRTADDEFVITYDSVHGARAVDEAVRDSRNGEEVHRSVLFGAMVTAQEMTDPWIVNTASYWDVPLQLMQEACNSCKDCGALHE